MGIFIQLYYCLIMFKTTACVAAMALCTANAIKLESDPICSSAGCTQYKHKKKDRGYDIDYFVPHFGEDKDISGSKESVDFAEKKLGHFWDILKPSPDDPPRNYFVPQFG